MERKGEYFICPAKNIIVFSSTLRAQLCAIIMQCPRQLGRFFKYWFKRDEWTTGNCFCYEDEIKNNVIVSMER